MNTSNGLALWRFTRYMMIGVSTFLLDLGMLYLAVNRIGIPYYFATPLTFLFAISCNYLLSRKLVFKETFQGWRIGYVYFISFALVGAVVTTGLVALLVWFFGLYYIIARIIVAGIVGIFNYIFNLSVNFNVAGTHKKH